MRRHGDMETISPSFKPHRDRAKTGWGFLILATPYETFLGESAVG